MSLVAISGNASGTGTLTIAAPNTNSDYTLTLPQATTTIVGTDATQTLTNKTIQGGAITSGTAVASTSGTSIDFTGLPSWVKRITVMFDRVSTNGTSFVQVQLGTSGGFVITGYVSAASNTGTGISSTTGLVIYSSAASDSRIGTMSLNLISGTRWIASGNTIIGTTANLNFPQAGTVDISGTLDRVRITTVNGTDTFDAGSINILYEG
jgi:hypothetical protein